MNLLTGTANKGNLPSCSCVLGETAQSVENGRLRILHFPLCGHGDRDRGGGGGGGRRRWGLSWTKFGPKFFWAPARVTIRALTKACDTIIGPALWKSILLLTWGAPLPKPFHIPVSIHKFLNQRKKGKLLQFQNGMNYRFHSHDSYSSSASVRPPPPLFARSPSLPLTLLFQFLVEGKHECFCSAVSRVEWVLLSVAWFLWTPSSFFRPFKSLTKWLAAASFQSVLTQGHSVSSTGDMNHG